MCCLIVLRGYMPTIGSVMCLLLLGLGTKNGEQWRPAKCSSVERDPIYSPKAKGAAAIEPDVESLIDANGSDKDETGMSFFLISSFVPNLISYAVLKIDRNYEYSVFVSYAEVYNEKIFDLLATSSLAPEDASGGMSRSNSTQSLSRSAQHPPGGSQARPLPRYPSALLPKSITSHLGFSSSVSNSSLNTGAAWGAGDVPGTLSRKALALKSDPVTGGKYVAGLREIRVRSAEEGKAASLT